MERPICSRDAAGDDLRRALRVAGWFKTGCGRRSRGEQLKNETLTLSLPVFDDRVYPGDSGKPFLRGAKWQ